jgi:DNA (cytosine-5)-methyltransferase 1
MLNGLDLFSGYGGITLALSEWVRPIAYCEIDRYAQGILLSRMAEGKLPIAPIWDNIETFEGKPFRDKVDIIYGGFPCQDISVAGTGKGLGGERSGLFFRLCELVEEIHPEFIFLENVPAIRTRGLREVIRTLTDLRYDCRWTCVSAAEVGAPHLRKRWFLLAKSKSGHDRGKLRNLSETCKAKSRPKDEHKNETEQFGNTSKNPSILANSNSNGKEWDKSKNREREWFEQESWWEFEPNVGRVVARCFFRLDRIKALGNGVVPQQVKKAFIKLMGYE